MGTSAIIGSAGQIVSIDYPDIDLSEPDSITHWIRSESPDVIINAAAYTDVDKAEDEVDLAWKINSLAPGILAEEALSKNSLLIHFSTDFVFDGKKDQPYQESDPVAPINEYGKSKLEGEKFSKAGWWKLFHLQDKLVIQHPTRLFFDQGP